MTDRPVHRTLLLAALSALALALAATPASALPRGFVGLSSEDTFHGSPDYRENALTLQKRAGVRLIRQNFDWAAFEKSRGDYTFAEYDSFMAAAARARMGILPVLYNAPSFHSSAPGSGAERGLYPPSNPETMADFAAALVRRYGPDGSFWKSRPDLPKVPIRSWQVWNEPSLAVYWRPRPDPAAYVRLLRTVGARIKSVDPRAEVVTAGLPPSKLSDAIRLGKFIRSMYRAGGKGSFDTLAINAYATDTRELARLMRSIRRILRRSRDRKRRIWITELGWADSGPEHRFNLGPRGQARMIKKAVRWVIRKRKRQRLRGFVYFQWHDQRPYPPEYKDMWGLHTGLVNLDGVAKPAYRAFKAAAKPGKPKKKKKSKRKRRR